MKSQTQHTPKEAWDLGGLSALKQVKCFVFLALFLDCMLLSVYRAFYKS